jgi:hypothetical protein
MAISRSRMLKPKNCVAVNTVCSARFDYRICVPVTFVAGNNLRIALLRYSISHLRTKRSPFYLKAQNVPRSKHLPPRLNKAGR